MGWGGASWGAGEEVAGWGRAGWGLTSQGGTDLFNVVKVEQTSLQLNTIRSMILYKPEIKKYASAHTHTDMHTLRK